MLSKEINPFRATLIVPFIEMVTEVDTTVVPTAIVSYKVEQASYIRVYSNPAIRNFLYGRLSMYARDMILAMMYFIYGDNDYVILTHEKLQELHGDVRLSPRRYDDTIRELIRNSVIDYKDKSKGQYWYNPRFFCQKSRVVMFPECAYKTATKFIGKGTQQISFDYAD